MKKRFVAFLFLIVLRSEAQQFIPLWPEGRKANSNGIAVTDSLFNERIWRVGTPGIYAFTVPQAENKGAAVLICPGGGYERLSYLYNGFTVAKWFNTIGVNAFVLIYRLPHQPDLVIAPLGPLSDAQRAMKIIRAHANEWKINPTKIGIMGTSAGGHVATTLGTYTEDVSLISDSIDRQRWNANFMILLSPVITMSQYAHPGSKKNLIGDNSPQGLIKKFSNELQVTESTPPAFIVHALNDSTVNVRNSLMFYEALLAHHVNASLHIFPQGGHGIRIDDNPGSTDLWLDLLEMWLKEMNFITPMPFK